MTGFHRYTLYVMAYVTACCILAVTPALADEEIDMALAEALISEIKGQIEVDKRAHERAVNALAETEAGKERMKTCRNRNTSYRDACLHGKEWKPKGANQPLYDQFHDEETAAIVADDREAMQGGGSDQRQVRDGRICLGMRLISATISENGDARNEEKVDKRQPLPNLVTITLPECTFQPRRADMNKDYDMLGASVEQVRQAFSRPVHVLRDGSG